MIYARKHCQELSHFHFFHSSSNADDEVFIVSKLVNHTLTHPMVCARQFGCMNACKSDTKPWRFNYIAEGSIQIGVDGLPEEVTRLRQQNENFAVHSHVA